MSTILEMLNLIKHLETGEGVPAGDRFHSGVGDQVLAERELGEVGEGSNASVQAGEAVRGEV